MPGMGRFISRDPFSGNSEYPASIHSYSYAYNNPLLYTDPSGNCVDPVTGAICATLAGAVIGAGANLAFQMVQSGGNWDCVDWSQVALWGGGGAVAGLSAYFLMPVLAASPDTVFDLASLVYDVYTGDMASFALDAMSLMIPGMTGAGALSRVDNIPDAYRLANTFNFAQDAGRISRHGDNLLHVSRFPEGKKMWERGNIVTENLIEYFYKEGLQNSDALFAVLGKNLPGNPNSYQNFANTRQALHFDLDKRMYNEFLETFGEQRFWDLINEHYIREIGARNMPVMLAQAYESIDDIRGFLKDEVRMLVKEFKYELVGQWLLPKY